MMILNPKMNSKSYVSERLVTEAEVPFTYILINCCSENFTGVCVFASSREVIPDRASNLFKRTANIVGVVITT
ncbi:hypothetical protein PILCRDRAFT_330130 [Piloderma croceum F 1598]|uniref:Uncharacterized protein n=1 Tax=Piloderma croceum (strain F 1598) TaxID=765440 RepID=A0A0C3C8E0_PILCF|nr:hypothetical protein PILCRDRAFT_330130 [Piloderma croceum F 1598]